ncbi:MAG TPA: hypothetical protein PKW60_13730, partial [Candidatus Hydrogenedentes bacterium]|nr:hypothetical protein [Candidatus Hydrogenedentota bacterium]
MMREYLAANELLSTVTQPGLEVFQITTDPDAGSNLFYNYHQAFEPTSRFMLFNRTGKDGAGLWLCDLEDDFTLEPVTGDDERLAGGHQGMAFSPDGHWIWYSLFADDRLELRRRPLTGGPMETVFDLDAIRHEFGGRKIHGGRWL